MLPSKDNIIDAIKDVGNFRVPQLNASTFIKSRFGDPLYFPGGFGMVFKADNSGMKSAVKIWYVKIDEIKERLQKISSYLSTRNLPYFVTYSFHEKGICIPADIVNDENSPIDQYLDVLIMDWADGMTLKDYLDDLITENPVNVIESTLLKLSEQFKTCFTDLHNNHISHGDLQHGNIVIYNNPNGTQIKLIDYDSLYVPDLNGYEQTTSGLAGFQHPKRIAGDATISTEKDDYFSEKIIYLSILLLAKYPQFWTDVNVGVESNDFGLLFRAEDFNDFANTYICNFVKSNQSKFGPEIVSLLDEVASDLNKPLAKIEALSGTVKNPYERKTDDSSSPLSSGTRLSSEMLDVLYDDDNGGRYVPNKENITIIDIDSNIYKKRNP